MSYALSAPLQTAVFERLLADAAVTDLVGTNIFDALPTGRMPTIYIALGPETVRDAGEVAGDGSWHDFTVSVVTETASFKAVKAAAGAVSDALDHADLTLGRGRLVGLWFRKARARRAANGARRIDLTFRARIDDI
ncbi:DUF3168 domain-containing protein [Cognatishimia sp. F0-27]|uniref:DUF3168 domain-containing protein n=1 Tax=Cognatishimia sp. F0-27 TaxID=2816855 RepID=UPI001D0C1C6A|nr:DUF3168 domain-containing protein [Cognatishimia sp. F0-27]MCC1493420.1 DUF3168 domain-containing protein [Cognatishimia sp. F0-27]